MSDAAAENRRADPRSAAIERARWPLEAGVVTAGAIFALGYLLGLVEGPVTGAIGGLGLMTFGRALGRGPASSARLWGAWAVLSAAAFWLASRWTSLAFVDLWGAQGVLGPTILVGPTEVAVGSILLTSAGVLAVAGWMELRAGSTAGDVLRTGAVAILAALLLVACAWGPAVRGTFGAAALTLAQWAGATLLILCVGAVLAVLARARPWLSWGYLVAALALVAAGASLVQGVL